MCSAMDDPTTFDAPEPTRPRVYVLAGDAPTVPEPKPSVALAVLGALLNEAEWDLERCMTASERTVVGTRISVLSEARDRVAEAER